VDLIVGTARLLELKVVLKLKQAQAKTKANVLTIVNQ
jgi:hypothetical protein